MANQITGSSTDQRLIELEIKATFAEDLLEQLDAVIVRQQTQIEMLIAEVRQLRESHQKATTSSVDSGATSTQHDLPPHF